LFFQTGFRDDHIDDGTLGGDFGSEVGIEQFCHQEKFEIGVIVDRVSSHFQLEVLA
jgi:hypothetical protein